MKRFSIYLLFALFVTVGYGTFDYQFNRAQWASAYRKIFAGNTDRLPDEAYVAKTYFEAYNDLNVVIEMLEHRRERVASIDFWIILHDGKLYKHGIKNERAEVFEIPYETAKEGQVVLRDEFSYTVTALGEGFHLVLGLRYLPDQYISSRYAKLIVEAIVGQLGAILIALAVFVFLFRDIRRSIQNLLKRGGRNFGETSGTSREAELLARGFDAYERQSKRLTLERDVLSWQVLPSLRTELKSGKAPPYHFPCTLVRTDINGFSKIFNEHPIEEFTETINEFFTDVSHIVARYGGLVHEFVGDEVIFYFKDEDYRSRKGVNGNSVAIALSALRDIGRAAERYNEVTMRERGYPFTIKSSLAHGRLRFGQLVNGYSLAGAVLIETVRILSHIDEKEENTITFSDRHLKDANVVAVSELEKRVHLKGFQEEFGLCAYRGHKDLSAVLRTRGTDLESAAYYRSDEDIVQILEFAREQARRRNWVMAGKAIGLLRRFRVTRTDRNVVEELDSWLTSGLAEAGKGPTVESSKSALKILASVVKIVENVVARSAFDSRIEALVNDAVKAPDRRVAANALDVLTYFKTESDAQFASELADHRDNRVAANAIVFEGQKELSTAIVRRLRNLLESAESSRTASALYAIGELAAYHCAADVVYYSTKLDFIELVNRVPEYFGHADEMVRRQAKIAAKKSAIAGPLIATSKAA